MKIKEILKYNDHRSWSIPIKKWNFYQEWNNAIFLHWKVELKELSKFVPSNLQIDLFDGQPWVSLVAFTMEKKLDQGIFLISHQSQIFMKLILELM